MQNRFVYSVNKDRCQKRQVILLLSVTALGLVVWGLDHVQCRRHEDLLARQAAAARLKPPAARAPLSGPLSDDHLSGIIVDGARSFAIINGRMMKAGDTVEGKTIVEILKKKVTLCGKAVPAQCVSLWLEK